MSMRAKKVEPILIDKIQDRNGKTIFVNSNMKCSNCIINKNLTENSFEINDLLPHVQEEYEVIIDPRNAYQMVSILEGAVQRNVTAASLRSINKTLAGKSGTTNDSFDTWYIGFSADLVVGTYIGFDEPKTLGDKESGAITALPVFYEFMKEALKDVDDVPFRIPNGVKLVRVDYYSGQPTTDINSAIYEAFLNEDDAMKQPELIENSKEHNLNKSSENDKSLKDDQSPPIQSIEEHEINNDDENNFIDPNLIY